MSSMLNEQAYGVDALSISWVNMTMVSEEGQEVVLIAPAWARQTWFPDLLGLLIDHLRRLPLWPDLLHQS